MAQKKTNTERISRNAERISDNADRINENADRIAELEAQVAALLGSNEQTEEPKKSTAAKKPAAKSTTTKSTATKKPATKSTSTAAKKPAAKSTATKKPAAKKPVSKETKAEPEEKQEPTTATNDKPQEAVVRVEPSTPVEQPKEEPKEEPKPVEEKVEEPKVEEKAEEPKVEEKAEEPKAEEKAEEPKAEVAATETPEEPKPAEEPKKEKKAKSGDIKSKADGFINGKGKLPIFIIANVLLVVSTVLLIVAAFNITTATGKTVSYNLFTYFGKAREVKTYLATMAGSWGNGGYIMIGILMILAMLVPLALAVKNVVLCFVKKDRNIHMLDAIITFAFMLAYLGVVNLFCANVTAGHVVALVIAIVLVAFTSFAEHIAKSGKHLPIFSMVNLALIIVVVFLLSAVPIIVSGKPGDSNYNPYYGARAAGVCGNGGFSFIMLLVSVFALVLLAIMQLKKLPAVLEIIVPIVSAACALLAVLLFGAGRVAGTHVGAGLIVGVIFDILLAAANMVFTLVPKLKRYKVQIKD